MNYPGIIEDKILGHFEQAKRKAALQAMPSQLVSSADKAAQKKIALKELLAGIRGGVLPRSLSRTLSEEGNMSLFKTVHPNIVQSIRAFRVTELAAEALRLRQHFLYVSCSHTKTKAEVLDEIFSSFLMPIQATPTLELLYSCLSSKLHSAGMQPGFVLVLEGLPDTSKFDREARENLLDVFRDATEYWADRRIPFRTFYSFT